MFSILNLPARVIGILEANVSPREIAFGVCLGMFLGFTPLNGTTALLLALFFFIFRVNRMATLLTLPVFKMAYLLGISRLGESVGSYFLEQADYLIGFWRLVTNLPVVAYLDINRTTVAGGIILSAILSIPVYFLSKTLSAALLSKYSEKMRNSALSKWTKRVYHVSNIIGPDAASIAGNVKTTVKQKVISKIKSAIIKPKANARTGIMKRLNIPGITIIAVVLIIIQVGVGLIISPVVGAFIVNILNSTGTAKVTVEKINVWPLTLSFSMKELRVYDARKADKRIMRVSTVGAHISPLAILSKRLVFSNVKMSAAELDLDGAPDGSMNLQRLAAPKAEGVKAGIQDLARMWKSVAGKNDWFGKIYSAIRKRSSKSAQEEAKIAKKVSRITEELPQGRLVQFKSPSEMYLFEIKDLDLSGRVNVAPGNAPPVELRNARIILKRLAFDPQNGTRLDGIDVRGELYRDSASVGKVELKFLKWYKGPVRNSTAKVKLDNVDLEAVRFIYEDSLPVGVVKGKISLTSDTMITGEVIDSRDSLTLTGATLEPKSGGAQAVGLIPISAVCEAINRIDPVRLKFEIRGTVDKPEFAGFQESLMELIKPYIANMGEQLKNEGMNALGRFLEKVRKK